MNNKANLIIMLTIATLATGQVLAMHNSLPQNNKKIAGKSQTSNGLQKALKTIVPNQAHCQIREVFDSALSIEPLQTLVIEYLASDWISYKTLHRSSWTRFYPPIASLSFSPDNASLLISLSQPKKRTPHIIWDIHNGSYKDDQLELIAPSSEFPDDSIEIVAQPQDNTFKAIACNKEWGEEVCGTPNHVCPSDTIEIQILVNQALLLQKILTTTPEPDMCVIS